MAAQLQTFIKVWKEFNFASFQRELDNVATDIATRQDESDQSRKKLVEQTREFKKSTPDETRKIVGPILKCFQFEIDNLTKRSIATETSFLNVYKRLVELPDPKAVVEFCHGLQAKAVKADDLEIEVKQLRETLKEYNEEFKEVRNQDVTIKQLREKIKHYEEKWDETLEARCQELQADLQSDFAEKEQILLDNQLSLTKKLRESEHRAIQYQAVLEQAQSELFDLRSKDEDRSDAKSQELELIINDLDRANQRASLAEKEVNQLREQLAVANQNIGGQESVSIPTSGNDMEKAIDLISRSSMELEIAAKEKEIAQLLEDVQRLQTTIKQLRETYTAQITQLEEQLEKRDNQIQQLQNKLDGQKDYEDIKRELSILKSIEFANIVPNVASSAKSLETLLLEKTKSLQNENTSLKLSNSDLSEKLMQALSENKTFLAEMGNHKELIKNLEQDLANIQSLSLVHRGEAEGQPSPHTHDVLEEVMKGSPSWDDDATTKRTYGSLSGESGSVADSMLPIVTAQRERFRARNIELEGQVIQYQQQVTLLQSNLDSLRQDNVKLYEKIRFLQSYPQQKSAMKTDINLESRYSAQYEEKLDPFASFSQNERQRKYANLSPFEKITLSMGRLVLSNKVARTMAFIYTVFLHILVFLVLYKMAHVENCNRDMAAEWHEKFASHMLSVHGQDIEDHHPH